MSLLRIENLSFSYTPGGRKVLDGINMDFEAGRVYAITGKSGAGKTTLLSLLSALTVPTEGKILVNGNDISKGDTYKYRCSDVGIVFQNYNLLPKLDAVQNVQLSLDISGRGGGRSEEIASDLLQNLGIAEYDLRRPILQLSGGQQQRVAIARAISYDPPIILADEPTGNLDPETEQEIMTIFRTLAHEDGKCVIIVTHSKSIAKAADITISVDSLKNRSAA